MEKHDIQKLRDLPIEGVAGRLGLSVKGHKALCPFHDDHHASLSFSVRRNAYRCFVCGARGDTISLAMGVLQKDFREACRWLADEHQVITTEYQPGEQKPPRPFDPTRYERNLEHPWLSDEARQFLFSERRIDARVTAWCRLTSWRDREGTPWLQIPYYDRQLRLTGIQNRNLAKGGQPRFRFPQGSACGIYNLPVLNRLKPGEPLFITEGCTDCWAMLSAGHKAIAIPSATLLSPADRQVLAELNSQATAHGAQPSTTFHMYPDRDEPGERLFLELKEVLPSLVHHQLPPGVKDFGEYYAAATARQDGERPP